MLVCNSLLAVDQHLRQARPDILSVLFGGFSIILFGDLGQLPPVGDSPFMARAGLRSVQGHACYCPFAQAFVLSALARQSADDAFHDLLVPLRNGKSSQDDYQLLCGRFVTRVDQGNFAYSVCRFPIKRLVAEHNLLMLRSLGRPFAVIKGVHNNSEVSQADSNTVGGSESCVSLAVRA